MLLYGVLVTDTVVVTDRGSQYAHPGENGVGIRGYAESMLFHVMPRPVRSGTRTKKAYPPSSVDTHLTEEQQNGWHEVVEAGGPLTVLREACSVFVSAVGSHSQDLRHDGLGSGFHIQSCLPLA